MNADSSTIASLRFAADKIKEVVVHLKLSEDDYKATNLPVADAVEHIISCLEKDAAYLDRLAEVCAEAAPAMKTLDGDE